MQVCASVYMLYLVTFPSCFSPTVRARNTIFAIHSFLEGRRTRFSSFDGNPVVSDQRQLGYLTLAECARLFSRGCLHSVTSFPNVPPLVSSPAHPTYAILALARIVWHIAETTDRMESDTDISRKMLFEIETFSGNFRV